MIDSHNGIFKTCLFTLTVTIGSGFAFAQMDVDQADSLDFQGFHKDKKEAVKIWKDEKPQSAEPQKAYEATPVAPAPQTQETAGVKPAATPSATQSGKRYELRERYTLSRSAKTPYSAFYVIESLHQQSAKLCQKGWKKLSERSEPVETDFFLYYEIECL